MILIGDKMRKKLPIPSKEKLYNLFIIEIESVEKISKIYNCSATIIYKWLKKYNIRKEYKIKKIPFGANVKLRDWIEQEQGKHFCHCGCNKEIKLTKDHFVRGKIPLIIKSHRTKDMKRCDECNTLFKPNGIYNFFCSSECKEKQNTVEKICPYCDKKFKVSVNKRLQKYCSVECSFKGKSGENSPLWLGGTTNDEYCYKFNNKCKESNRDKFNHKCFLCGTHEGDLKRKLSVHHVDYNKNQGCDTISWKLVPLCGSCHSKTNNDRIFWENLLTTIITIRSLILDYDNKIDWRSIGI